MIVLVLGLSGCETGTGETVIDEFESTPEISGIKDIEYEMSAPLPNYFEGVTVSDELHGDLSGFLRVDDSNVNYHQVGVYPVFYEVTSPSGEYSLRTIDVTVSVPFELSALPEDIFIIRVNGSYGIMDHLGEVVLTPMYDALVYLGNHLIYVELDNNTLIYDAELETMTEIDYQIVSANESIVIYKDGDQYGIMNHDFDLLTSAVYDDAFALENGLIQVGSVSGSSIEYGVLDELLNFVVPMKYDSILVKQDGCIGMSESFIHYHHFETGSSLVLNGLEITERYIKNMLVYGFNSNEGQLLLTITYDFLNGISPTFLQSSKMIDGLMYYDVHSEDDQYIFDSLGNEYLADAFFDLEQLHQGPSYFYYYTSDELTVLDESFMTLTSEPFLAPNNDMSLELIDDNLFFYETGSKWYYITIDPDAHELAHVVQQREGVQHTKREDLQYVRSHTLGVNYYTFTINGHTLNLENVNLTQIKVIDDRVLFAIEDLNTGKYCIYTTSDEGFELIHESSDAYIVFYDQFILTKTDDSLYTVFDAEGHALIEDVRFVYVLNDYLIAVLDESTRFTHYDIYSVGKSDYLDVTASYPVPSSDLNYHTIDYYEKAYYNLFTLPNGDYQTLLDDTGTIVLDTAAVNIEIYNEHFVIYEDDLGIFRVFDLDQNRVVYTNIESYDINAEHSYLAILFKDENYGYVLDEELQLVYDTKEQLDTSNELSYMTFSEKTVKMNYDGEYKYYDYEYDVLYEIDAILDQNNSYYMKLITPGVQYIFSKWSNGEIVASSDYPLSEDIEFYGPFIRYDNELFYYTETESSITDDSLSTMYLYNYVEDDYAVFKTFTNTYVFSYDSERYDLISLYSLDEPLNYVSLSRDNGFVIAGETYHAFLKDETGEYTEVLVADNIIDMTETEIYAINDNRLNVYKINDASVENTAWLSFSQSYFDVDSKTISYGEHALTIDQGMIILDDNDYIGVDGSFDNPYILLDNGETYTIVFKNGAVVEQIEENIVEFSNGLFNGIDALTRETVLFNNDGIILSYNADTIFYDYSIGYYVIESDGIIGLINESEEVIIPQLYDEIYVDNGVIIARSNRLYTVYDMTGTKLSNISLNGID